MTFKILLADDVDLSLVDYDNCLISPKYDGIRAVVKDGVLLAGRSQKPIPNEYVRDLFGRPEYENLDGELIVGEPNSPTVYLETYSGVMKKTGTPNVTFYAFDHFGTPHDEYEARLYTVYGAAENLPYVVPVMQHEVRDEEGLLELEERYLNLGYEGLMLRKRRGSKSHYKFGRSTAKEGTLLKLKRLVDFEAKIIGYEEELANNNEATTDANGHTVRSSHKENKTGKGTLGKFICEYGDLTFKVGIFKGFDAKWKKKMWDEREALVGQWAKLQKLGIGEKDRPRHPRVTAMLGLRDPIDMS